MSVARYRTLWRLWRREREDPEPFYRLLAAEAATDLEQRHGPLAGQRIVDLGCGNGLYTIALRERGADVIPVDNDPAELEVAGPAVEGALIADAGHLPLKADSIDGAFCSNLLEHTPGHHEIRRPLTTRPRVDQPGSRDLQLGERADRQVRGRGDRADHRATPARR